MLANSKVTEVISVVIFYVHLAESFKIIAAKGNAFFCDIELDACKE